MKQSDKDLYTRMAIGGFIGGDIAALALTAYFTLAKNTDIKSIEPKMGVIIVAGLALSMMIGAAIGAISTCVKNPCASSNRELCIN